MRPLATLLIGPALTAVSAQCPFTPTVMPDQAILCPGGTIELGTQAYETYQWYADGTLLDGETGPTLVVNEGLGGQSITVAVTLDGCMEQTAPVLVDGWVFLLPYTIHGGDEPYGTGSEGESFFCDGDTLLLVMGSPYTEHIQWTDGGVDIPAATNDTLVVTTTGSWSASGAPGVCPDWVQHVGVEVPSIFTAIIQPEIVQVDDQLCPVPEGEVVLWYVNGAPVATTGQCIDANVQGSYVVNVTYTTPCSVPSEPFLITTIKEVVPPVWSAYPTPANDHVFISGAFSSAGSRWMLMDATGRAVRKGWLSGKWPLRLDVSGLSPGRYWFVVPGEGALVLSKH